MVPEIALTPQTIERFAGRFPGRVAVLHSGLTAGQRLDQWWAIKSGEYSVVVGSRSAVFAPVSNLGLVVLDEEHEWTYKQHDAQPRYHARGVAATLGRLTGSVTLLGSASAGCGILLPGTAKAVWPSPTAGPAEAWRGRFDSHRAAARSGGRGHEGRASRWQRRHLLP